MSGVQITEQERPRWILVTFLAVQVALPVAALAVRWGGGPSATRFGWHMFTTA